MGDFNLYFALGVEHILTWEALDHLLFVTILCIRYTWKDWKKVAIMVTAFTIGHSITLMLSGLGYLTPSINWIEFLIPITIAITALNTFLQKPDGKLSVIYFFALFFGLVHGLAYATTMHDLEGSEGLVAHLFAFNVGIEVGQLVVVALVLTVSYILVNLVKIPSVWWFKAASIVIFLISLKMAYDRIPTLSIQNI